MIAQSLESNGAIVYILGRRQDTLDTAAKTAVSLKSYEEINLVYTIRLGPLLRILQLHRCTRTNLNISNTASFTGSNATYPRNKTSNAPHPRSRQSTDTSTSSLPTLASWGPASPDCQSSPASPSCATGSGTRTPTPLTRRLPSTRRASSSPWPPSLACWTRATSAAAVV
jgi:hypothetical protein